MLEGALRFAEEVCNRSTSDSIPSAAGSFALCFNNRRVDQQAKLLQLVGTNLAGCFKEWIGCGLRLREGYHFTQRRLASRWHGTRAGQASSHARRRVVVTECPQQMAESLRYFIIRVTDDVKDSALDIGIVNSYAART